MEAEDPLSQLRDIHLPEPVSFWPPAPGWWLLLLVLIIGAVYLSRHTIAAMIRRRKLEHVLRELEQAHARFNERAASGDSRNDAGLEFLAEVNRLLKRVTQVMYPQSNWANLTGRHWLEFLDSCDGGTTFSDGVGAVLGDGVYRPSFDADAEALYQVARQWIENRYSKHRQAPAERSVTA